MSTPKASSVAARYLQIPLRVMPDYGDSEDTSAAVPRGKEAGTMIVRQMTRVKVRTFGAKDLGDGQTEVTGVMNIDFGDAEILPLRFKAVVAGTTVIDFRPVQAVSGGGAAKVMEFYRDAFQMAVQMNPGKLASDRQAKRPHLNKEDPGSVLAHLRYLLVEKHGLEDFADEIKQFSRKVDQAWQEYRASH